MDESLDNESRLHGWRVQGLFESMIVGLGGVRLIKEEYTGNYYFDDTDGDVKPPDFRLIRTDGEHLLVEVKGVGPKGMVKPKRIRGQDLEHQQRYAELTGSRLVLVHYRSALNRWTVVDPKVLVQRDDLLPIETALKANELGLLGDAEIGTEPPLVFLLLADVSPQTSRTVGPDEHQIGFTVGGGRVRKRRTVPDGPVERRIAWFLMLHGNWNTTMEPEMADGRLVRAKYYCEPDVDSQDAAVIRRQGFAIVGSLSSMYSTLDNEVTLTDIGELCALRYEPAPGSLSELIPPDYWQRTTRKPADLEVHPEAQWTIEQANSSGPDQLAPPTFNNLLRRTRLTEQGRPLTPRELPNSQVRRISTRFSASTTTTPTKAMKL